jgi:apolipoprotein N-acyltransferase
VHDRIARLGAPSRYAIAATASTMMGLGAPPDGLTWLVWLGFFPLVLVLRVQPRERLRQAFALGVVGGVGTGLVGFPWIGEMLERFGGFSWPVATVGLLVFSLWTAIPFGVWAVGVVLGPQRGALAIAWPAVLWVALSATWPALFPYTPVIGLSEMPEWIQAAELLGVGGVEAQVVIAGVLAADGLLSIGDPVARKQAVLRLAVALAIPLSSWSLGRARLASIDAELASAPAVRFGVVQPNVPIEAWSREDSMLRLRVASAAAQDEGAQVIVWPEAGAFPYRTTRPFRHDFPSPAKAVLWAHALPTIFGAASIDPGGRWEYNTVYNMRADGTVEGSFDKTILVPFGEYVPLVDPAWAIQRVPAMAHNLAGVDPARFEVEPPPTAANPHAPTFHVGPLVCYEDIFAGFARRTAAQPGGIEAFVNVTIDTWFGDTAEPWEHLALAQFRSVEHRIPMVRSVAAGASSVVDAGGRLVASLPVQGFEDRIAPPPERLVVDVALARNTERDATPYALGGWIFPHACQLAGLLALAGLVRSRYRRRAA